MSNQTKTVKQETCGHKCYRLREYTCTACAQQENEVLKAQIKMKEERIEALVSTVERLTNLTNRLLLKFKTTTENETHIKNVA